MEHGSGSTILIPGVDDSAGVTQVLVFVSIYQGAIVEHVLEQFHKPSFTSCLSVAARQECSNSLRGAAKCSEFSDLFALACMKSVHSESISLAICSLVCLGAYSMDEKLPASRSLPKVTDILESAPSQLGLHTHLGVALFEDTLLGWF